MRRARSRRRDIYWRYREVLGRPELTVKEVDQMRKHLGLLARTICEYVWGQKFY